MCDWVSGDDDALFRWLGTAFLNRGEAGARADATVRVNAKGRVRTRSSRTSGIAKSLWRVRLQEELADTRLREDPA